MTYDTSLDQGAPYELFDFSVPGTSLVWRYTTEAAARSYGGHTYAPEAIERGEVERAAGTTGGGCTIVVPDENALALALYSSLTARPVDVLVRQFHRGEDTPSVVFRGQTMGVTFDGATATIACGSRFAMANKRKIVWLTFQPGCNWAWGETECGVNRDDFRTDVSLSSSAQTGRTLTASAVDALADGYFNGGWVERVATGDTRFVESHVGATLLLGAPFPDLTGTVETFHIFPGCEHNETDCDTRFNNLPNYLGWSRLPSVNPFNRSAFYLSPTSTIPDPGDTYAIPEFPGYTLILQDTIADFGNVSSGSEAPTTVPTSHSLVFNADGTVTVSLAVGEFYRATQTLPVIWVQPQPAPSGLPALFEINSEQAIDTVAPSLLAALGAAFDTWHDMTAGVTYSSGYVVTFNTTVNIRYTLRVRTAVDGLVRVAADIFITFIVNAG